MTQTIITIAIVVAAAAWLVWKYFLAARFGKGVEGCGCEACDKVHSAKKD